MVKIIAIVLITNILYAQNIFQTNCLKCHNQTELTLFIKEYTLKYSSEQKIKKAIFKFLKYPTSNMPLMTFEFIRKKGYKTKSTLDDKNLKKAIDIYYGQYNMKRFIK